MEITDLSTVENNIRGRCQVVKTKKWQKDHWIMRGMEKLQSSLGIS
jgi:hypothetical protein